MRYGRDFDRGQWGRGRQGGMGRGFGGSWDEERGEPGGPGPEGYGVYGSDEIDNSYGGYGARGRSAFGTGGGAYDNEFGTGRGHEGYGGRGYVGGRESFAGGWDRFGEGARTGWEGGYGGYGLGPGLERERGGREQDETRRMRASEIMTENPETVTADATLADAARKMRDLNVGIIPVVESDQSRRLRGVITDRDIAIRAVAEGKDTGTTRVMEVMTTDIETCNKNDTVADILLVMQREQVRRVPITDREGRLVGIVAQADVARDIDTHHGEHRVADTLERISEPTRGGEMRGGTRRTPIRGSREAQGPTRSTQQRGTEE